MSIPVMMMAAATAVSAASSIQQGEASKAMADYNATVAQNNATVAQQTAAVNQAQQQWKATQFEGAQKAAAGASGVDPGTGSPLDLVTDTARRSTLDALNIKYEGQLGVNQAMSQSTLDRLQGNQAMTGGMFKAAGSVLTGASYMAQGLSGGSAGGGGMAPYAE